MPVASGDRGLKCLRRGEPRNRVRRVGVVESKAPTDLPDWAGTALRPPATYFPLLSSMPVCDNVEVV